MSKTTEGPWRLMPIREHSSYPEDAYGWVLISMGHDEDLDLDPLEDPHYIAGIEMKGHSPHEGFAWHKAPEGPDAGLIERAPLMRSRLAQILEFSKAGNIGKVRELAQETLETVQESIEWHTPEDPLDAAVEDDKGRKPLMFGAHLYWVPGSIDLGEVESAPQEGWKHVHTLGGQFDMGEREDLRVIIQGLSDHCERFVDEEMDTDGRFVVLVGEGEKASLWYLTELVDTLWEMERG